MVENNCYATTPDEHGKTRRREGWLPLMLAILKVYLATHIFIGLKKQPNIKTY